jgi:hypothetical protein
MVTARLAEALKPAENSEVSPVVVSVAVAVTNWFGGIAEPSVAVKAASRSSRRS